MESAKVSKAFKYPAAADVQVRITNKAALGKVLDDVKKKMSTVMKNVDEIIPNYLAGQRKNMEESYFGHLFLHFNVKFSADLVHHLLRRQVHTSDNMKYLEFNFGGNKAQFRKKEFDKKRLLQRFDVITNAMVKDAYTNTTQWMEDDDMVKLSLLYILECDLLGKESHSEIKLDYVSMVWGYEYDVVTTLDASLGEENMLTVSEHEHDEHHDDIGHDIVESPLKRARTNIHEGVDAHHSIPQQSPHQNVQQFEATSSRQGEDTQKYIIPPSTQDEDKVVKVVHIEEEVNNNEDVNKEELVNKMEDMHTADTINKMEDTHTADTVNKMEETHTIHIEDETHIVHTEEETYTVYAEEETHTAYRGGYAYYTYGGGYAYCYKRLRRQAQNVKSSYVVNKDLKKRLKNTLPTDQFNPMKPAAEGVIQAFTAYLLKDPPEVFSLGEYEPITLEFMQVMTKTIAWLTNKVIAL
ncbi:hypothetical protein FNV43_RR00670 [Rhamnella rubrinervis]|uniref:Uncharacterized protein n=1 Tax=Rhamnella rubrinervis TaxID=2594499 RepID=A0A8K0HNG2_9ROSA|nr:hypothetical protein FNV43_RR00670 [Rhamnella rubrinervis]